MIWRVFFILATCGAVFLAYAEYSRNALSKFRLGSAKAACRITYVYDGDTIALTCDGIERTVRLVGFDAPEISKPRCAEEAVLGFAAKDKLRQLVVGAKTTAFYPKGKDKYDRALYRVELDGIDVATSLVQAGVAEYYRGGHRLDWCKKLGG